MVAASNSIFKLSAGYCRIRGRCMGSGFANLCSKHLQARRCNMELAQIDTLSTSVKEQDAKLSAPAGLCQFPRNPLGIQ
jgi:hypothetical protein